MWQKYYKYIIGFFLCSLIILVLGYFSEVVSYVLISWVISMIGEPIMNFLLVKFKLLKFSFGKSVCALFTIFLIFFIVGGVLYLFIPIVIQQAVVLSKVDFNSISSALQEPIEKVNTWLRSLGLEPGASAADQVKGLVGEYFDPAHISAFFGTLLGQAGNILIGVFSIIFISFFFLKERGLFTKMVLALVPTGTESKVRDVIQDISALLTKYFGGIVLQMAILMVLISSLLGLIGIKNAMLIAFFYGIMNIIPYLGPLIGAAFGCLLTISSSLEMDFYQQTIPLLIKVLLVFSIVKLLDDFIVQPYIFSKRVQAHPLEIFLVIMIGARINGIFGMILAIPTYTIFRVIAKVFLSEIKLVRKITEDLETESSKLD
ncbi:MAG: AI-2E family transporter [Saprospiraceae bacterium]|nr:AI-2E family transporter [Candidatus Vicinibacter affinis]MBK7303456.1 AI-2E family transporter [Candidatus Vicinibacter affinis]MBK7696125.1 AI-2E family transporter [Candidatus Vicinibacter affinis]